MNFKQIETFRSVMLTRSMTMAATQLHTSQPNVSRVIGQLEKEVGFPLFERVAGRLAPTEEAEALFRDVERAFIGLDNLRDSARSIRRLGTGTLRIGAAGSIAMSVVPLAIRAFGAAYPDVPIVVHTGSSATVAKWTATHFCDIGLVSYTSDIPGVDITLLRKENGVCVAPGTHRLARRRRIRASDLDGERFISLPYGSATRLATDAAFDPDRRLLTVETPFAATICTMVNMGLGVGIVNPIVTRSLKLPGIRAIPFDPAVEFRSYVVRAPQFPATRLANFFLECLDQAWTLST
ncbi:LysR family transcriptional regulator [Pigmentiphaga litoralis]|uniref:LysR family transcriptional regulator n=1 Tax=Pigmentiphaga litoralis TaxID=516702 RepID=UPI0016732E10|nr:LysR family transcriptional regulator [Pigmentiphaga litoralis]GGX30251.1 LysR family transcriptional regulator [Pigmentiphaga litoralis]